MNISIERKKEEAIKRMRAMKLFNPVIKQFEKEGLVNQSEPPFGACYWLDDEQKARVKEFEEKRNALVYHVIRSFTNFGTIESYLYISDYEEDWVYDREDLKESRQLCYGYNVDMPDCSEFGTIGIALTVAGGLKRTW